jgi:hypothetical protein
MIKIRALINGWNDRCQPFVWTNNADQILTKANRKTTSVAVHWENTLPAAPIAGLTNPGLSRRILIGVLVDLRCPWRVVLAW